MSFAPTDWSIMPAKMCFAACPESMPCECRERAAWEESHCINIYDQELVERLKKKAAEADDPGNWISLAGMTDQQIREALFSKE